MTEATRGSNEGGACIAAALPACPDGGDPVEGREGRRRGLRAAHGEETRGDAGLMGESRNGGSSWCRCELSPLRGLDLETKAISEEEIRFTRGWTGGLVSFFL